MKIINMFRVGITPPQPLLFSPPNFLFGFPMLLFLLLLCLTGKEVVVVGFQP